MAKHADDPKKGHDDPDKKFGKDHHGKHRDDNRSFDPGSKERKDRIEKGKGDYGHQR